MEDLIPEGYVLDQVISDNVYRKVSIVKNTEDNHKYVIKVYKKDKVMQNKSIVQSILNEK